MCEQIICVLCIDLVGIKRIVFVVHDNSDDQHLQETVTNTLVMEKKTWYNNNIEPDILVYEMIKSNYKQ